MWGPTNPRSIPGVRRRARRNWAEMGCHVVLCGWLRAQPRHVRKIAAWYEGRGHVVTELLTPVDGVLPSRMKRHAAAALAGLQQRAGTEGGLQEGLLFHCFSGHGAILHALIAAQMHGHGAAHLGRRHIGTIYDSVPARCDSDGMCGATAGVVPQSLSLEGPVKGSQLLTARRDTVSINWHQLALITRR